MPSFPNERKFYPEPEREINLNDLIPHNKYSPKDPGQWAALLTYAMGWMKGKYWFEDDTYNMRELAMLSNRYPVKAVLNYHLDELKGLGVFDGVEFFEQDRIILNNQNDPKTNGIYEVSSGEWQYAQDFNDWWKISSGVMVYCYNDECLYVLSKSFYDFGVSDIYFDRVPFENSVQKFVIIDDNSVNSVYTGCTLSNAVEGISKFTLVGDSVFDTELGKYKHASGSFNTVGKNFFDGILEYGIINIFDTGFTEDHVYDSIRSKNYIPVPSNKQFIISRNGQPLNVTFLEYDRDKKYLGIVDGSVITTTSNTKFLRFYVDGVIEDMYNIQLEFGDEITDYEYYKGSSFPITLKKYDVYFNNRHLRFTEEINLEKESWEYVGEAQMYPPPTESPDNPYKIHIKSRKIITNLAPDPDQLCIEAYINDHRLSGTNKMYSDFNYGDIFIDENFEVNIRVPLSVLGIDRIVFNSMTIEQKNEAINQKINEEFKIKCLYQRRSPKDQYDAYSALHIHNRAFLFYSPDINSINFNRVRLAYPTNITSSLSSLAHQVSTTARELHELRLGTKIIMSHEEPEDLKAGDWWYKIDDPNIPTKIFIENMSYSKTMPVTTDKYWSNAEDVNDAIVSTENIESVLYESSEDEINPILEHNIWGEPVETILPLAELEELVIHPELPNEP